MLRWYVHRLIKAHGPNSLIIACHDETDRIQAEEVTSDFGIYIPLCAGATPLQALGEVAAVFPGLPLAYFHVEAVFAPSDLLDRVLAHHRQHENNFTFVSDLPSQLTPEVVDSALILTLARVNYGPSIPSVREAVMRLGRVRADLRAEPFQAAAFYAPPKLTKAFAMVNRDDATRAQQVLSGLPEDYAFEAIERWPSTTFEPVDFGFKIQPPRCDRPRVLFVSPSCAYAGAEECLRGLVQELGRMGFQQTAVLGAEGLLAARLRETGCDVITANWHFAARNGPAVNERFAKEVLDRVAPDVIYCNDDPGDAFRTAGRRHGSPIIRHIRAVTSSDGAPLGSYEDANHYIAVSDFARRQLVGAGIKPGKISVVYDGVDTDRFSPNVFDVGQMRREFDLPQNAIVVLMIARPVRQKRHDLMLDAFFHFRKSTPSARLVFVGDHGHSPYLESMRQNAWSLDLTEYVTWLPFQDDIRQIHCASDILVLPSDGDALGTCILEAMSLGRPVVVSDSGGAHELLQHETSGLVVPGGDAHALAATLRVLAEGPSLRTTFGTAARHKMLQRFTLRSHAEQVAQVLQRLDRLND